MASLSSLLRFSHFNPHYLSPTLKSQLKPYLSSPRAAAPNSGDSPPSPPPENITTQELKYNNKKDKKKKKGKNVIRRDPLETSAKRVQEEVKKDKKEDIITSETEGAFVLTWLGLGFLILVEGIALAASGFLPEEWDNFLVKYLYPAFTPTIFLFLGGSVAYGVIKYFEAEKMNKS